MFVLDLNIRVKMGTYISEKVWGGDRFIMTMMIKHLKIGSKSIT